VDRSGRLQDVNRRLCQLTGKKAGDLLGALLVDLVSAESAARVMDCLAVAARDGEARGIELALAETQGHERIVQIDAMRISDAEGTAIGTQIVARDITEERRLLRELHAERQLLQTIYRCVPAGCILFDRDGTILAANPLVERVAPIGAAEMLGRNVIDIFGNPGPSGCPVTRAFLSGRIEQQVSWLHNRAGQKVYVHRTAGPIIVDGRVEKVIEMIVDVSEQLQQGDLRILALWHGQPNADAGALPGIAERRSAPRARTSFAVRYRRREQLGWGTARSLAAGGALVELAVDEHFEVGDEIELEWSLPGDETAVCARSVIVWTRPGSHSRPAGLGLRFLEVTPAFAPITQPSLKKAQ